MWINISQQNNIVCSNPVTIFKIAGVNQIPGSQKTNKPQNTKMIINRKMCDSEPKKVNARLHTRIDKTSDQDNGLSGYKKINSLHLDTIRKQSNGRTGSETRHMSMQTKKNKHMEVNQNKRTTPHSKRRNLHTTVKPFPLKYL